MTSTKSGKGEYWKHGESIGKVQFPKIWRASAENGNEVRRVGKQHVMHFFGPGKMPQPCSGIETCFYCKDGNARVYKYRTIIILDGKPKFSDLDGSLSRTIADMQILLNEQGVSVEQIQKKVYLITRAKELRERPAYVVMITGEAELPEIVGVDMSHEENNSRANVEVIKEEKNPALKKKSQIDLLIDDVPTVGLLTEDEVLLLKGFEDKLKRQLAEDPNWDMADAIKTALKRKAWSSEKIALAMKFFDKGGVYIRQDELVAG